MSLFPRTIKRPLDVTIQRSHDADASKHRGPVERGGAERDQMAATGDWDRFVKGPLPALATI
jgi:hypothetical protein